MKTIVVFPDSSWYYDTDGINPLPKLWLKATIDDSMTSQQIDKFINEYLLDMFYEDE